MKSHDSIVTLGVIANALNRIFYEGDPNKTDFTAKELSIFAKINVHELLNDTGIMEGLMNWDSLGCIHLKIEVNNLIITVLRPDFPEL